MTQKTAVIYARFSCSKQREASIEDQLRVCHEWCPIAMLSRTLGHQVCIAVFGKSILLRITFG